jgi:hypothetical protein
VYRYRHKRKRLLFISTQFAIHAHAGSPFPEACAQRLPAGSDLPGTRTPNAKPLTPNANPVSVIQLWPLEFICYLLLVI